MIFDGNIQIQHILGNSIEGKQDSLFIFLNSVSKELRIIPFIRDPVLIRKGQKIQSILLEGISEENIKLKLGTIINAGSANLEKNQWLANNGLPYAASGHIAELLNNKIHVIGGEDLQKNITFKNHLLLRFIFGSRL